MISTCIEICNYSAPHKNVWFEGEALAFRMKATHFYGADKARSASDRPHEQAAKRLRMRVLNGY